MNSGLPRSLEDRPLRSAPRESQSAQSNETSFLAAVTYRFPGPTILSTRGILSSRTPGPRSPAPLQRDRTHCTPSIAAAAITSVDGSGRNHTDVLHAGDLRGNDRHQQWWKPADTVRPARNIPPTPRDVTTCPNRNSTRESSSNPTASATHKIVGYFCAASAMTRATAAQAPSAAMPFPVRRRASDCSRIQPIPISQHTFAEHVSPSTPHVVRRCAALRLRLARTARCVLPVVLTCAAAARPRNPHHMHHLVQRILHDALRLSLLQAAESLPRPLSSSITVFTATQSSSLSVEMVGFFKAGRTRENIRGRFSSSNVQHQANTVLRLHRSLQHQSAGCRSCGAFRGLRTTICWR